MKNLTVSFMLSVVAVFAARAVVLDKAYLAADRPAEGEAAISRSEALVFRSGSDRIYGQILRPNVAFGKGRPVVIFCHASQSTHSGPRWTGMPRCGCGRSIRLPTASWASASPLPRTSPTSSRPRPGGNENGEQVDN